MITEDDVKSKSIELLEKHRYDTSGVDVTVAIKGAPTSPTVFTVGIHVKGGTPEETDLPFELVETCFTEDNFDRCEEPLCLTIERSLSGVAKTPGQ